MPGTLAAVLTVELAAPEAGWAVGVTISTSSTPVGCPGEGRTEAVLEALLGCLDTGREVACCCACILSAIWRNMSLTSCSSECTVVIAVASS